MIDYVAPFGFRIAVKHPDHSHFVVQNGNAYDEGLRESCDPIKEYWADKSPEKAKPLQGLLTLEATKCCNI